MRLSPAPRLAPALPGGVVQGRVEGVVCRLRLQDDFRGRLFAGYAEAVWDETYRVPADTAGDLCDYPLARNLVLLAVAVASEALVRFVADGTRQSWSLTLRDFAVRPLEAPHG